MTIRDDTATDWALVAHVIAPLLAGKPTSWEALEIAADDLGNKLSPDMVIKQHGVQPPCARDEKMCHLMGLCQNRQQISRGLGLIDEAWTIEYGAHYFKILVADGKKPEGDIGIEEIMAALHVGDSIRTFLEAAREIAGLTDDPPGQRLFSDKAELFALPKDFDIDTAMNVAEARSEVSFDSAPVLRTTLRYLFESKRDGRLLTP